MSVLPAPKTDFIGLEGKVHLATGGEPPLLVRHREAFDAFASDKARGMDGYDQHWAVVDETRTLLAPHFALAADEIALIGRRGRGAARPWIVVDVRLGGRARLDAEAAAERPIARDAVVVMEGAAIRVVQRLRRVIRVRLTAAGWRRDLDPAVIQRCARRALDALPLICGEGSEKQGYRQREGHCLVCVS